MKITESVVAALIAAAAAAGCAEPADDPADNRAEPGPVTASATPTPTKAPKVRVVEVGYGFDADMFGLAEAIALVENPSTDVVAVNVGFTAYDKGDTVLAQQSQILLLGAQQTSAVNTGLDVGEDADIARVTAEVDVEQFEPDDNAGKQLTAAKVTYRGDEYSDGRVTGVIRNGYREDVRDYRVTAVCHRNGGIIGGGFTYTQGLHRSGTDRAVDVDVAFTGSKDPDRCDLYAAVTPGTQVE